jgi:hypothetical protein
MVKCAFGGIVMAKIITQFKVSLPGDLSGMTEENFMKYLVWQRESDDVSKRLITPFKDVLCDATGYTDSNRPATETSSIVPVGQDITYKVTTKPTTKRPSYSKVNASFRGYLDVLIDQYTREIRRKDIMTIDGQPYVAVDDVLEHIDGELQAHLEGKEGIEQHVELANPSVLVAETPQSVVIVVGRDYSALTDFNARTYEGANKFLKEGNAQAKRFKEDLLKDSLFTISGEVTEVVALAYPFDGISFIHQIEPRKLPQHKDILYALIKEKPSRITTRSNIGDLTKAKMFAEDGGRELLESKGLLDQEFISSYSPAVRSDQAYVRLLGLVDMFSRYMKEMVKPTLEQNIYMKPGNL